MNFWERFVHRVYFGLCETVEGRDAAADILDMAFARRDNRLDPVTLTHAGVLLVLAAARRGPLRATAVAEAVRRSLDRQPTVVQTALRTAVPPRLDDLAALNAVTDKDTHRLWASTLVGPPKYPGFLALTEFLGRLRLALPADQESQALMLFSASCVRYYGIRVNRVPFAVLLYRHVLRTLRPTDRVWPIVVPTGPNGVWFEQLGANEQWFLNQCGLFLPEPDVLALYLHLYSGLSAAEMADVYQAADASETTQRVVGRIRDAWLEVLR
jgi:hypothetical protein